MKRYFVGIYCPPQAPCEGYAARNNEKSFGLLKEAGVDHVFGHYEDKNGIDCLKDSLENAGRADVKFYPRLKIFDEFLGIDNAVKGPSVSYPNLSEDAKKSIHTEFENMLSVCNEYKAFGGILIGDERGCDTFEGIGAAQKHFSSLYPNKLFMYNNLNYFIDDQLFFYSSVEVKGEKKRLEGELSEGAEHRFPRYDKFIGHYIDNVTAEYISTDVYPFAPTWAEVPTSIHRSLYEVQAFYADLKERTGLMPLTYVQVGNWDKNPRYIGENNIAMHFGIAAAYNFDGFVFFPGCFPNDWIHAEEGAEGYGISKKIGLLDDLGEPTEFYDGAKRTIAHFQKIGEFLTEVKWLGVQTAGEFVGGFEEEKIKDIKWNECIYRGGLPENEKHPYSGSIPVSCYEHQLFVGAFETKNNVKMYIIVNNSIVTDNKISLKCDTLSGIVMRGEYSEKIPSSVTLAAGESILLIEK